jgi:hypothetical protein
MKRWPWPCRVKMFFKKELILDIPLSEVKKGHPPAVGLLIDQHGPRGAVKVAQRRRETLTAPRVMLQKKQDDGKAPFFTLTNKTVASLRSG